MNSHSETTPPESRQATSSSRAYLRNYYREHREHILKQMREAYAANPEPFRRRRSRWYRAHKAAISARRRTARAANPQPFREKERAYRERNLEEYNRRQRRRHQSSIPKVSNRLLALFRKDAHREEQLGIAGHVVCRECGGKLRKLRGGAWSHVRLVHKMSVEEYQTKWPGAPLVCAELRKQLSVRAKRQMASARGRPRQKLARVRGHEGEKPMSKWALVRLLQQGCTYVAAGKELRRTLGTIEAAAHQVGISGPGCIYDLGEPFYVETVQRLKRASGLSASRIAEQVKIPKPVMAMRIRPRRKGQRIRPDVARKIIAWRDGTIRRLVAAAWKPEHGEDKYSGSRVLKTLLPGLNARRDLLHEALRELRRLLRARPNVAAEDLGEFLCEQAMLETAQNSSRKLFVRFLPWAPELMPFLQANFDRLRSRGNLSPLAEKALAARWGSTHHVLAGALRPRTGSIPPKEMRALLARAVPGPGGVPERAQGGVRVSRGKKPGPEPYPFEQKAEYRIGKKVEEQLPTFERLSADLRSLPRRARTNREKTMAALAGKGYSEKQIEAAIYAPTKPLVASRWFVSRDTGLQFDAVAEYSRRFRRAVAYPQHN